MTFRLTPVRSSDRLPLRDKEARPPKNAPPADELRELAEKEVERIVDLQRVLYADARFALLVVLQGRDAAGKDGTIRKVFEGVNPQGAEVTSFKAPTPLELEHDFLWRIHQRVPARRMIGIFNRSHYEDVLVPRVRRGITKQEWTARYQQINDFERMLTAHGVVILKFFLHVSRAEQKKRLEKRLEDPTKNWKYREGDLGERKLWNAYAAAYRDALRRCSTPIAPWYVIPADSKKLRNWLVARTIADTLERLGLKYPKASDAVLASEIT
jgi:PPK2 family polyphosphate:nucleotide phosphotransferase